MATIRRLASATVLCGLFLLGSAPLAAGTYYVSLSGNDKNDGKTPERAWRTVAYAATKATAGDTVFIKAGLYRGEKVAITNSGTEKAPIIFQGYKNKPGDTPDPKFKPGDKLNPEELPVLDGDEKRDWITWREGGRGIVLSAKSYVEIRNLGLTRYFYGVYPLSSQHIVLQNVIASDIGSTGFFLFRCADCTIRDCVVADAGDINISLRETHNSVVEKCRTYGTIFEKLPSTDYYIGIADGHDNILRDCLAHNLHAEHFSEHKGQGHPGHGIGIKDVAVGKGYPNPHSYNNKVINCVALNMGECFFVAHEAHHNEFVDCTAINRWKTQSGWNQGIDIRDGAHDNVFRNCRVEGALSGAISQDTEEGPKNPNGSQTTQICAKNAIVNCVFVDCNRGIEIQNTVDTLFRNCVFDRIDAVLVRCPADRKNNQGNVCRNAIVTNCPGAYQSSATGGIAITYSNFWKNKFGMPTGKGNMAKDPLFADAAKKDYHLKSAAGRCNGVTSTWVMDAETSPCIDAGNPSDDYTAEPQPNGGRINIGAYGGADKASKSPSKPGRVTTK